MRQLTQEGLPRQGRGLYKLKACVLWYVDYWRSRAEGRSDPERQQTSSLKNKVLAAKLAKETGEYIPRAEVMQVWTAAFLRLGKHFDGLATSVGRELSWSTDTIRTVRARLDEGRENFARDSAEYIDPVEVKKDAKPSKKKS